MTKIELNESYLTKDKRTFTSALSCLDKLNTRKLGADMLNTSSLKAKNKDLPLLFKTLPDLVEPSNSYVIFS